MSRPSTIIDYAVGRATNDVLTATTAVWFKDEDEDEGERIGPVYLQVPGREELVPFAAAGETEVEWAHAPGRPRLGRDARRQGHPVVTEQPSPISTRETFKAAVFSAGPGVHHSRLTRSGGSRACSSVARLQRR
jgi:hypothetical protein